MLHAVEAVTPVGSMTYGEGGSLLVDCTCGAEISVPQGQDEGRAINTAMRIHRLSVCYVCGTPYDSPDDGCEACDA